METLGFLQRRRVDAMSCWLFQLHCGYCRHRHAHKGHRHQSRRTSYAQDNRSQALAPGEDSDYGPQRRPVRADLATLSPMPVSALATAALDSSDSRHLACRLPLADSITSFEALRVGHNGPARGGVSSAAPEAPELHHCCQPPVGASGTAAHMAYGIPVHHVISQHHQQRQGGDHSASPAYVMSVYREQPPVHASGMQGKEFGGAWVDAGHVLQHRSDVCNVHPCELVPRV